jgi:ribose transport system permease protein
VSPAPDATVSPPASGPGGSPAPPEGAGGPDQPAPFETRWGSDLLRRGFAPTSSIWIFFVLLAILAVFSIARPHQFLTAFNIRSIAINASVLLVMAVGMTYVIVTAGIDLSVGSVLVFSGVIAGKVMDNLSSSNPTKAGWGVITIGLLAGLAAGAAWGLVNGVLVARAKIPPLIVTLGTLGMSLGLAEVITNAVDLRFVPNRLGDTIGNGRLGPIPWLVFIAAGVTVIGGLVLALTRFGRYTFAIGSNEEGARRVGINVTWHLIKVYGLSGLLAGLAGDLSLAHFTTTTISGHANDNLAVIAAVVLGGTSLFGGVGTMFGTVVGIFIPAVLESGFVIMGIQTFWQDVAVGAVLIVAVYLDQLRRRARARQ